MVQFKLQHRDFVQNVTFNNVNGQPSWSEISWKIGGVCNINHADVALTYLDPDGDKITIWSQAELREYYLTLDEDELKSGVSHKFIVRDLNDGIPDPNAANPREDKFLTHDDHSTTATFGGERPWGRHVEERGGEWKQHIQEQNANNEQEDEKAYRERIQASIMNVFGTSPPAQQLQQPQPRQRNVSTQSNSKKSGADRKPVQVSIVNVVGTSRPRIILQ
jgi:hypothetical protein